MNVAWQQKLEENAKRLAKPMPMACCNKRILEQQPDFCEQKSLVQETN